MLIFRKYRWKIFFYHLFFIGLVVCRPAADFAYSQTRYQNPQDPKSILILNTFESNIPAFEKTNQGLSAALRAGGIGIRNQYFESLDMVRNPGFENIKLLKRMICQRYCERKIDMIITLFPEGLQFLLDMGQSFFPEVPVLALFLPNGFELPQTDRRIIPHLVIPDLKKTIQIGLKLVPKAERIYFAGGTHPLDRWLESIARKEFKQWERQLDIQYLSDMPLENIIATVATAPSNSIVFITAFSQDATGKYQTTVELSRQLSQISKAPVFGFLGTLLGNGIAGGSLLSFEYIGTKAGELALDILSRTEDSGNIPIILDVPQLDSFDWLQLKHWNLSESDLPRGSIIVNKEFSLWDLKYYAMGVLAFILAQSLLIIGLLIQKRRRRLAEESLRRHREELAHVTRIATMGELTTSLAHEINQPLTAILSNAEAALRFLSRAEPDIDEVRQILEDIIRDDRRADNVMQNVRAMVRKEKHHDELLDLNKVIEGVIDLICDDSLLDGLSIALELAPELKKIQGNRVQLQQVTLNLILNSAAAMSDAPPAQRKIIVRTAMPTQWTVGVSVTDFGSGLDANKIERLFEAFYTTKPEGLGMGLSISQTIIDAHGGNIEASNNPDGGATFSFTLPVNQGDSS